jgi:hypothetical protein
MTKPLPKQFRSGMSEQAVTTFIDEAEHTDYGTPRYPWPNAVKVKIRRALKDCRDLPDMKQALNRVVVEEMGGGFLGRGPFPL